MVLILLQKGRKNVALQAPAGVGKTAAVVGFAQAVVNGDVPDLLKNARVLELDLASMAAGTATVSEFQGRFVPFCKAIAERYGSPDHPRYILFIDEMHQIMPTCENSSYKGLSEVMKPYLTAGDLYVIGATTLDEFRMYVAVDPAMDRRFQKVNLKIPNAEETFAILQALRPGYVDHHSLEIPDEMLHLIIELTERHMRKRNQPDKSIMVMDSACAYSVMNYGTDKPLADYAIKYIIGSEVGIAPEAL